MKEAELRDKGVDYPVCKDCGKRHHPCQPAYDCLDAEGQAAFHLLLDELEKDPELAKQITDVRAVIDRL